jgi:hypothetical protein
MARTRHPWTVRRTMIAVAILAVVLALLTPVFRVVGRMQAFSRQFGRMRAQIDRLVVTGPPGFDPQLWSKGAGWAYNYAGNIWFYHDSVSPDLMQQTSDAFETKLAGRIEPQTVLWLLDQIAATGRNGSSYDARFRVMAGQSLIPGWILQTTPKGIDPALWNEVARASGTALVTIYYDTRPGEEGKPLLLNPERAQIRRAMDRVLTPPATLESVRQFWDELAASGTIGRTYVEAHQPACLNRSGRSQVIEPPR